MTVNEAEKIIEKFHQSIRDLRPDAIVQSNKALPYTSATIKYAHFVYGEDLIKNFVKISGKTPEELEIFFSKKYNELMESYGIIDSLFREDSEDINTKYKEFLKCLKKGVISNFRIPNPFGECEPVNEYRNFIGENWFLAHHTNLFNDKSPLGAFVCDALRKKAINENNVKLLIEITNTALTRSVDFPGKKDNDNSKFI
jgi:hypothetical protein